MQKRERQSSSKEKTLSNRQAQAGTQGNTEKHGKTRHDNTKNKAADRESTPAVLSSPRVSSTLVKEAELEGAPNIL